MDNNGIGYPIDKDSAKKSAAFIANTDYSGTTDAVQLIDRCIEALSNEEKIPQAGNKAVVITVQNITDVNALENKISEAESDGISVYVMALTNENAEELSKIDGVYVCGSALELRLNIAELYGAFNNITQVMSMSNDVSLMSGQEEIIYSGDYRIDKHNFNTNRSFGSDIASVLNMYGCLPLVVNDGNSGYNIFSTVTSGQTILDLIRGKAYQDNFNTGLSNMIDFYDALKSEFSDSSLCVSGNISDSQITDILDKNLKYSFPVVAFSNEEPNEGSDEEPNENSKIITQKVENSSGAVEYLDIDGTVVTGEWSFVDTYEYFIEIISDGTGIVDYVSESENLYDNIRFTKPSAYSTSDAYAYIYASTLGNDYRISVSTQGDNYLIEYPTVDSTILRSVRTDFEGIKPKLYNTNNAYIVKKYNDVNVSKGETWYYQSLFKATNLGIIGGDTDKYDAETQTTIPGDGTVVYFNPQKPVSRAEFLKMLLVSAGFDNIQNNNSGYWAKNFVDKAIELELIKTEMSGNALNESFYEAPIQRYEAAYALYKLYIEQRSEITVPSNLYKYNESVSCERNTRWKSSIAFSEQNMFANQIGGATTKIAGINDSDYIEGIYQMYLNGVMEGNEYREFGALNNLTKAEAAKILEKSLFTLDEGLENVRVVYEGAANYIDFSQQDTHTITGEKDANGSGEFYFVAPKTGYYYISDISGCQVTVSDMKKRDIKGLDGSSGGARYNILKGETAYVKVMTTDSSYSFTISAPDDEALVFAPDRSGTFIYDNCPEYIIQEDLADSQYGNTALITAENISGDVTVASSHLVRSQSATIQNHANTCNCSDGDNLSFDYLITNNSGVPITVTITNIGIQTPAYENPYSIDKTYLEYSCYQAWADYLNTNLINEGDFIGNKEIQSDNSTPKFEYESYNAQSSVWANVISLLKGKTIEIQPNETKWLFGEAVVDINLSEFGFPIFIIFDCTISGNATICATAFHNRDNISINNLSPGKIYTENSYRDYTNEVNGGEKHEIGEKYKGVSNSLAQVYSEGEWVISNNENTKFYSPKIYNRSQFNGVQPPAVSNTNNDEYIFRVNNGANGFNELTIPTFKYWMTHLNSESERNYSNVIMGSDMLGLKFDGIKVGEQEGENQYGTYYFDNYHTDTNSGNQEVGNGIDDPAAIKMANFSVTENYSIRIKNTSSQSKKIYYMVGNGSGMYYEYSIKGNDSSGNAIDINNSNIRCVLPWSETDANGKARCVFYEMFSFEIGAGEERQLEFEIVIPNIGSMGVYNILYAE